MCFVITCHYKNEEVARQHFSTKGKRAIQRRPSLLTFFEHSLPIDVYGLPSAAYQIKPSRFQNAFVQMARALFFHDLHSKLNLPIHIIIPSLINDIPVVNRIMQRIKAKTMNDLHGQRVLGNNTKIFTYQYLYQYEIPRFLVMMTFYGGFEVIADTQEHPLVSRL